MDARFLDYPVLDRSPSHTILTFSLEHIPVEDFSQYFSS